MKNICCKLFIYLYIIIIQPLSGVGVNLSLNLGYTQGYSHSSPTGYDHQNLELIVLKARRALK